MTNDKFKLLSLLLTASVLTVSWGSTSTRFNYALPASSQAMGITTRTKYDVGNVNLQQLKDDVSYIAAYSRFPSDGYKRAAEYLKGQAQVSGLTAQSEMVVDLPQWERLGASCTMLLPNGTKVPLTIVSLTGSVPGEVSGEVVRVENFYKSQKPSDPRFDRDGRNRIAYFSRPLKRDHTANAYIETVAQRNNGPSWAAENGAKAALIRSIQTGDGPPHTGTVTYVQGLEVPAAALSVDAANKLEEALQRYGTVSVHLKIDSREAKREQENVIIEIPGTSRQSEIVLVSAHLDSHDITPGAADDAAGVAAVLAVMRQFATNRQARTILLVFFADEELTGAGNEAFLKNHPEILPKIVSAMEIDDGDGAPYGMQVTELPAKRESGRRWLKQHAKVVGPSTDNLEILASAETNGTDLDKFWRCHGIPEVAILQDMTLYFDRHHAENDTVSNIDWPGLRQTTSLLLKITRVLASGSMTPPRGVSKIPCE